jgi:hypothetical protein
MPLPEPDAIFAAIAAETGVRLFTVTVLDPAAHVVRRAYTTHPEAYPVSGTKPLTCDDGWSRQVLIEKKTFITNSTDGFRPYFPDHALINSLGCHSAMNIPVLREDGKVAGTVNLLDVEGFFTSETAARIQAIVAARHGALLTAIQAVSL